MTLSNTATPRYYGEFRDAVLSGEIPVCKEVAQEMNRIDNLIRDPRYYYDEEAVEGWIAYCEKELTLTDGSDVNLLPSFKLWGEQVFGWYYFENRSVYVPGTTDTPGHYEHREVKNRLTKKQYLIVARGAAKSMYTSFIQSYYLNVDTSTTHQICTAPTMRQAEETMSPIRTSITRARGPLFKFLTEGSIHNTTGNKADRVKLSSTKKGIENFLTGSLIEVRPMTIDKLQGLRPKISTLDEWLSGDVREDVISALEQGASKVQDYLIIAVSSEGTVRNSVGDDMKLELLNILKGDYHAPHVSIWYYRLDDVTEVGEPEKWLKANPNLGKTVSYEAYHLDVERAENAPSARNDILAKRFGIPTEGYTYFFTYEETIPHNYQNYDGMVCAVGADLSQGDDFTAFSFLFPLGADRFGVKSRCYISERTLMKLPGSARNKYEEFINEGSLMVMPGTILDMEEVTTDLIDYIEAHGYEPRTMGYDPYNAAVFLETWEMYNGPYGIVKVPQGVKTETVPLRELKTLSSDRQLIFDESIMMYAMGNAVAQEDTNGNIKLLKKRYDQKVDPVAAMMDAYVAYKRFKDEFE